MSSGCCATWPATPRSPPLFALTIPPHDAARHSAATAGSALRKAARAGRRAPRSLLVLRRLGRCRQGPARPEHRRRLSHRRLGRTTGWSPSISPTPATPPPKSRSPSARRRHLRHPARPRSRPRQSQSSASSSRASPPRSRSTTAPSPKPRPACMSAISATPAAQALNPARRQRAHAHRQVISPASRMQAAQHG